MRKATITMLLNDRCISCSELYDNDLYRHAYAIHRKAILGVWWEFLYIIKF